MTEGERPETPGSRIERFIRGAMAQSPAIHNITALHEASGVSTGSIYAWFRDIEEPGARSAQRICQALGQPLAAFWSAWTGEELPPDEFTALAAKMDALAGEVANLVDLMAAQIEASDARTRQGRAVARVRKRRQGKRPPPGPVQ